MAERIEEKEAARLQRALEERGIDRDAAAELAEALRSRLVGRSRSELKALMDGVELGCQVQRAVARSKPVVGSKEMERLFEDFAIELKKLDEGLRALAAYANRLRKRPDDDEPKIIH
jgi:hypothetical protein